MWVYISPLNPISVIFWGFIGVLFMGGNQMYATYMSERETEQNKESAQEIIECYKSKSDCSTFAMETMGNLNRNKTGIWMGKISDGEFKIIHKRCDKLKKEVIKDMCFRDAYKLAALATTPKKYGIVNEEVAKTTPQFVEEYFTKKSGAVRGKGAQYMTNLWKEIEKDIQKRDYKAAIEKHKEVHIPSLDYWYIGYKKMYGQNNPYVDANTYYVMSHLTTFSTFEGVQRGIRNSAKESILDILKHKKKRVNLFSYKNIEIERLGVREFPYKKSAVKFLNQEIYKVAALNKDKITMLDESHMYW